MKEILKYKFDFFHGSEAEQFNFYRIPKMLFTDKRFSRVSVEAKVLYGLLLDRMSLSIKNDWIDEENRVYIYFKLEDAMEFMNIGKDKGVKLFAELDAEKGCGLIRRKRQGLGKPVTIYVMNFNSKMENETEETPEEASEIQTSENPNSGLPENGEVLTSKKPKSELSESQKSRVLKNRSLDFGNSETNNTEYKDIENSYTEFSDINPISSFAIDERQQYRILLCYNIEYDVLKERYGTECIDGIVDIVMDLICCKNPNVFINGNQYPQEVVKNRMLKLQSSHIEYVLDCMSKVTTKIKNIKAYLISALYNAVSTMDLYYTAEFSYNMSGRSEVNEYC